RRVRPEHAEHRPRARPGEARTDRAVRAAPHLQAGSVGRDRAQAEEQGRIVRVPTDPLDDHRRGGHQGRSAEREETSRAERCVDVPEGRVVMASRVFAVDLGAWSVKLAIASPGLRGATLFNVVERMVPPGEEPTEDRAKRALTSLVDELR